MVTHTIKLNLLNNDFLKENWCELVCWNLDTVLDLKPNCSLFISSRYKSDSYEIDYGNGLTESFTFEGK